MPGRDGLVRPPFVALALVLLESATVAGGALRLIPSAPKPSAAESLLANAVSAAQSELSRAQCAEVFSSSRNPDGRIPQHVLDELRNTGRSYLELVLFLDGEGSRTCEAPDTLAFTSPGSRIVLRTTGFLRREHVDPGLTTALLIHEELHSLGLRQNPPDTKEITARAIARYGR